MRYARQVLLDGWDVSAQVRLKASTAIIVGAGGLGCPASETLARAGVGHIHLIDDDTIEMSNLQRQTLFTASNVGQNKAETASEVLNQINPLIEVSYSMQRLDAQSMDDLSDLIAQKRHESLVPHSADHSTILLLDCTDNFAIRQLLNEISVVERLPLLSASAIAMTGQLALYEPYKNTGCYYCVFGEILTNKSVEQNCANSGVLASTTTVMGNMQANLALQYLGLGHNPLSGQLLNWDGKHMSQHNLRFKRDYSCKVCAGQIG
ncbi:HesA/MoeB/ThiF family protein [Psychrobacter sp. DM4]|uniref:HesA/MoeB/ThiF family protein n=1 Tax=Psychrobacter sp. DM4 TaxID=3440637 RepID=UPI003F4FA2F6